MMTQKNINIVHILPNLDVCGGTPQKTLDLIGDNRINPFIIVYSEHAQENLPKYKNITTQILILKDADPFFQRILKIFQFLKGKNIDIIQAQFAYGELLGVVVKLIKPSAKLLICFVGPFLDRGFKGKIRSLFYLFANHFVYVSKYVHKSIASRSLILKNRTFDILHNGANLREISNLNYKKRGFTCLYIGGFVEWKNHKLLIDAFKIICQKNNYNDTYLILVGDGPKLDELKNYTKAIGLQKYIHFTGYQKDIGYYFSVADLYCHPSYAEGFGVAVVEAMLHGITPVLANSGAFPELVDNYSNGVLLPHDDPYAWAEMIRTLKNNPKHLNELSAQAKLSAEERFSAEAFQDRYWNVYKRITS